MRPVPKLTRQVASAINSSTISPELNPSVSSLPVTRLAMPTSGIVKPMVAQAEHSIYLGPEGVEVLTA